MLLELPISVVDCELEGGELLPLPFPLHDISVSVSMKAKKIEIRGDLKICKAAVRMHASELIERGICLKNGKICVRFTGGSEHIDSNQLPLTVQDFVILLYE